MRHLPLIIDAIIDLVPEDFKRREDFKNSLSVIRGHSLYKAPEMATAYVCTSQILKHTSMHFANTQKGGILKIWIKKSRKFLI